MKKISRTKSLAERMEEPIGGIPDIWSLVVKMNTLDIIKLRTISGKSSDKDLAEEIRKIVHNYLHENEKREWEKRVEEMEKNNE